MTATAVTDRITLVLADNAGLMTLGGTNSWIVKEPGAQRAVVIDPGPSDAAHLEAVVAAAGQVGLILFTHRHGDHTQAVDALVDMTGAPARSVDATFVRSAEPLSDGERIELDGLVLNVLTTPGHTDDSTCFEVPAEKSWFSGDTILGHGTTVIAHPDGDLGAYLASMDRIKAAVDAGQVDRILPGHGPVITEPARVVDFYIAHRLERLEQVRQAVAAGAVTSREVVERVYKDVDESLWFAAEQSVKAQLAYLT